MELPRAMMALALGAGAFCVEVVLAGRAGDYLAVLSHAQAFAE